MQSNPTVRWAAPLLVAAGLALAMSARASNQLTPITLKANIISTTFAGRSRTGAPIEILSLSRRVRYSDLDLTTPAGITELETRVQQVAHAACRQLDPLEPSGSCTRKAVAGAMRQVRHAVAAAKASCVIAAAKAHGRRS